MQGHILLVVSRQYSSLIANIKRIHRHLKKEFRVLPLIHVLWAGCDTDPKHQWVFDFLLNNNYVNNVFYRPEMEHENKSVDINKGISYVLQYNAMVHKVANYNKPVLKKDYIIINNANVFAREDTYGIIDRYMRLGERVIFFSENGHTNTNFVAINLSDERYFPPIVSAGDSEKFIHIWNKQTCDLPCVCYISNYRNEYYDFYNKLNTQKSNQGYRRTAQHSMYAHP